MAVALPFIEDTTMVCLPVMIASAALVALPPADRPEAPKAVKRATARSAAPSRERIAVLQSTLKHRRAFRDRYRGNADRQRAALAGSWYGPMATGGGGGWSPFAAGPQMMAGDMMGPPISPSPPLGLDVPLP